MVVLDILPLLSGEAEFNLTSACGLYAVMFTGGLILPGALRAFRTRLLAT